MPAPVVEEYGAAYTEVVIDVPEPAPQVEPVKFINALLKQVRCLGLLPFTFERSALMQAAREFVLGNHDEAKKALEGYYKRVAPKTAADLLALPASHEMGDYPPLAAVLPWMMSSPDEHLLRAEQDLWGRPRGFGVSDGSALFGPVSRRMLRVRLRQLTECIARIQRGSTAVDISGVKLIDDRSGKWVLDLREGADYCTALGALKEATEERAIVVKLISPDVLRSEVRMWHQVQTGLFTKAEALGIFDKYFEGVL